MYALSKLNKQNEQTWISLQKRLSTVQFEYKDLFESKEVHSFINNKSISVGSCIGYFIPSLLTTTSYLLACNQACIQTTTHQQNLNIYTIFVGYPGTGKSLCQNNTSHQTNHWIFSLSLLISGKSSAILYAAQEPLDDIEMTNTIIHKTTSSGLVKLLATNKKGLILSPEVFDVLYKLLKSDEDNGTGDVQLLCKMFSGEKCSYHFSTEYCCIIDKNTPFCILGSTQLTNAAKLIAKMDQGHGLVDRLLIATPLALRPLQRWRLPKTNSAQKSSVVLPNIFCVLHH